MRGGLITRATLAAVLASSAAGAQPTSPGTVYGTLEYRVVLNSHGAVLRSPGETLYLGRDCDAYSPQYGRGRWEWANGGFLVVFRNRRIGFARQHVDADPRGRCGS